MSAAPAFVEMRDKPLSSTLPFDARVGVVDACSDDDEAGESWGRRTDSGWCASMTSCFVSAFVSADPFQQPLRGRPQGAAVSENLLCTLVLFVLIAAFSAVQAVRLRGAPPITVSELWPSEPTTAESLIAVSLNKWETTVSMEYTCRLSDAGAAMWARFITPEEDFEKASCVGTDVWPVPLPPFDGLAMAAPVAFVGIESALMLTARADVDDQPVVGSTLIFFKLANDPRFAAFDWNYVPWQHTSLEVSLEVVVDERLPAESRTSQRVHFGITENYVHPEQNGAEANQTVTTLSISLAPTYTRFTVTLPDWVLPLLSSMGGAFTGLVIALSAGKMALRALLNSSACKFIKARMCCDPAGCMQSEVDAVVRRQYRRADAMEPAA